MQIAFFDVLGPLNDIFLVFLGAWEGDYAHINQLKRSLLFILMTVDMKNIIYSNNNITSNRNELVRRLLSGITMSELQNLVNIREEARPIPAPRRRGGEARPIPAPRRRTPIPTPRRNVRQLIQYFEDNPFPSYRPIPAPRTKKQQPVPAPRTKINKKGGL